MLEARHGAAIFSIAGWSRLILAPVAWASATAGLVVSDFPPASHTHNQPPPVFIPLLQAQLQREQSVPDFVREAREAFQKGQWERTLQALDHPGARNLSRDPELLNLRGAALAQLGRLDEARAAFREVLAAAPDHFWAAFNLVETDLMAGNPSAAREGFAALIPQFPKKTELLRLKIAITWLAEDNPDAAREIVRSMPFPCDTPAWYAARAALEFYEGRNDKGRQWLAESEEVFPGGLSPFLLQTLKEAGLLPESKP